MTKCSITQFYLNFCNRIGNDLNFDLIMGQGQMQIHHSKANKQLSVLAIVIFALSVTIYKIFTVKVCMTLTLTMFALSVTVCKITTFNPPKLSQFQSLTFKKYVTIISYKFAEHNVGWLFYGLKDGEKNSRFILNHLPLVHQ